MGMWPAQAMSTLWEEKGACDGGGSGAGYRPEH